MWLASVFMVVFLLFGWMATGLAQENTVDIDALTQAFRDVKRVRVVVGQTYEKADKVSLPFYEYAEKILNYAGLSVVEEDATTYDATISIEAKGIPGSASYGAVLGTSHWTKATVEGKISFSAGDKTYRWDFSYTEGPYQIITGSYSTPNNAPFKAAFNGGFIPALFKAIAKVLGMPPLISALKDKDGYVRRVAAWALGEINPKWRETEEAKRKVPEFISALKDEDGDVRLAAAEALKEINPKWRETEEAKRKVPEFISALKDEDGDVRYRAAWALGVLKDPRAVEPLIPALKDKDRVVRSAAARALGELKDPCAVEPLITALKDENIWVRKAAAEALEKITGEDFGEDEAKWRDWLGEE